MERNKRITRSAGIAASIALVAAILLFAAYNRIDLLMNPPDTALPENNSILLNIDNQYKIPVATFHFSYENTVAKIHACFDTGCAINTISDRTYRLIKGQGYVKKEYFCPLLLTDSNKSTKLQTRCVHIDIPVQLIPDLGLEHCIKNVRFFVIPSDEMMTLGVEFLKEFVIHSEYGGRQWLLDHKTPQKYMASYQLKSFNWHMNDLGGRYYWPLAVGDTEEDFFIDTAYGIAPLQMPIEEYKGSNPAQIDSLYSSYSVVPVKKTYDTLAVKAGDITFNTPICFIDGQRNTYYVVNPQALSTVFNISYDLKNKKLYVVKQLE